MWLNVDVADKKGIWALALERLGARAEEALVIENAQTGIDAAVELGVKFSVGVGSDPLQATVYVARLGELIVQGP